MTKLEKMMTKLPPKDRLAAKWKIRRWTASLPYEERLRLYAAEKIEFFKQNLHMPAEEMQKQLKALQDKYKL
jgi:hypothetical protein